MEDGKPNFQKKNKVKLNTHMCNRTQPTLTHQTLFSLWYVTLKP